MQNTFSGIFNSYDLYGKTFPGIVVFVGLIAISPIDLSSLSSDGSSLVIAVLTVLVAIFGFILGQAIHSIAQTIQSVLYKIGLGFHKASLVIRDILIYYLFKRETESDNDNDNHNNDRSVYTFRKWYLVMAILFFLSVSYLWSIIGWNVFTLITIGIFLTNIGSPRNRIISWLNSALIPHRKAFESRIAKNSDDIDDLSKEFNDIYESNSWPDVDIESKYTLTIGHLRNTNPQTTQIYLAIYSFCRSMWISCFILSIPYLLYSRESVPQLPLANEIQQIIPYPTSYNPLILDIVSSGDVTVLYIGLVGLVFGFIFLEAERKYKKIYIDYMLSEFIISESNFDGNSS